MKPGVPDCHWFLLSSRDNRVPCPSRFLRRAGIDNAAEHVFSGIEVKSKTPQSRLSGTYGNSPPFQRRESVQENDRVPFRGRLKISRDFNPAHTNKFRREIPRTQNRNPGNPTSQ